MKLKTLGKVVGAIDTGVQSYTGYLCYRMLSGIDYNKLGDFFSGDYPLEYKIGVGAWLGTTVAFTPIVALGVTDGLVDVVKGTHHYFGCRVWQKFTRSQEKMEKIDRELEQMLERIEQPISYKARE